MPSSIPEPMTVNVAHLIAAADTLGEIMSAFNTRRLLAEGRHTMSTPIYEMFLKSNKTDQELLDLAADAFEKAALALAAVDASGAMAFQCSSSNIDESNQSGVIHTHDCVDVVHANGDLGDNGRG